MATKRDIIVLAGKGHEPYQEINGEKFPFSDYQVVENYFKYISKNIISI